MSKFFDLPEKYDILIFDVNLWYHKNYHTHKDLSIEVGNQRIVTGGIYGFLKTLQRFERDYLKENGEIYFLFDNPNSKYNIRQLSIDPTYKANRKEYSKPFYRGLDYLRLILMEYHDNYTVIYGTGFEADDLVPNVLNTVDENKRVLAISDDLDWARIINYKGKKVDLYMQKKVYTKKEFNEKYNFLPNESNVVLYKVIRGDTSDNIPVGIPNIPSKIVEKLVGDYKDIFEILENIQHIPYLNDTWKDRIIQKRARLRLNHQLVSFIPIDDSYLKRFTFKSVFRPKSLSMLYKSLGFNLREVDKRLEKDLDKGKKIRYNDKSDSFFHMPEPKRE